MRALADEARRRGVARLWLEVILENTSALRLYEKLGYAHVRDVEVWSLGPRDGAGTTSVPLADAQRLIHAHRTDREPWQRSDATVARLNELDPPPEGLVVGDGAAILRAADGRVAILQLAGSIREVLEAVQARGEPASLLNLPADDPAAVALRELGGAIIVRQHELLLELAP